MSAYHPIQPFFVLNTDRYLKRPGRGNGVAHYYSFRPTRDDADVELVVPDGSLDIMFRCDVENPEARVFGPVAKSKQNAFETGMLYFGVRIEPGAFDHLGNASMSELVEQAYRFEELTGEARIVEEIAAKSSFAQRVSAVEDYLGRLYTANRSRREPLLSMLALIYAAQGNIHIHDLAKRLGYSERHINRIFHDATGLSAKKFCRYVKFQSALARFRDRPFDGLGDIAANCGYCDQSHLQIDFREFASCSPGGFRNRLNAKGYFSALTLA